MKRKLIYTTCLAFVAIFACKRDDYWNQNTDVQHGSISGTLTNTDDNTALKGIKILFERQTKVNGERTFIDTVSTDEKGLFRYEVPYPNKVKVSVRDTGRYNLDETFVELTEKKDYPIELKSFPRFGESSIHVDLRDMDKGQPLEDVNISLLVKESQQESYSLVETIKTDEHGIVDFKKVAFPVRYKVRIQENKNLFEPDSLEGRLLTKDVLNVTLKSKQYFGKGALRLQSTNYFTGKLSSNEHVLIEYKSIKDAEFSAPVNYTLDNEGRLEIKDVIYPGEIKISSPKEAGFPFSTVTLDVTEKSIANPILFTVFDLIPRYGNKTPSANINENTLEVFFEGDRIRTMELDSKSNIYAVTEAGELIKITRYGVRSLIASGFKTPWGIAIKDDQTLFVSENTDGHTIQKVSIDPVSGKATVTLLAGEQGKSGTADGDLLVARFNRPGDLVYDKSRNCLWVGEWSNMRIRKVDLATNKVSTFKSDIGYYFGVSLSDDAKYLYLASHTSNAGIYKYDIDNDKLYMVRSGLGSTRHVAVAPNGAVYFTTNKSGIVRMITTETLVEATGSGISNSDGTVSTVAGGALLGSDDKSPALGYKGPANVPIFKNVDGSPAGVVYDAFMGRLYIASPGDGKLYFVKLTSSYE